MKSIKEKDLLYILYIFILFPFFKPACIPIIMPRLNTIFNLWQLLNFMIVMFMTIKYKKISKINILVILFVSIYNCSTFINDGNINDSLVESLRIITVCFLIDNEIKIHPRELLISFESILYFLIIINLLSVFIYSKGLYVNNGYRSNWFLGFKNSHILYMLPAILLSIINSNLEGKNLLLRTKILILISIITLIKVWSATSLVAIALVLCFIAVVKVLPKMNFNLKIFIMIYLGLFFSIIILRLQNAFKYIIVDILKKDLTFTGRTYIWDYVIEKIKQKPFFGYGFENMITTSSSTMYAYNFSHNAILEILKKTGFCGLLLVCSMMGLIIKKLSIYKNNIISKIFSFFIFIYLIMMLMEAYDFEKFFFLFPLAYNIDFIVNSAKKEVI